MMEKEILKSAETLAADTEETQTGSGYITKAEVETICQGRKNLLKEIRSAVYLKFYNDIDEKLENEKWQFEQLLNWQDTKDEALSCYSFVLNPHYFEQKFLITEV